MKSIRQAVVWGRGPLKLGSLPAPVGRAAVALALACTGVLPFAANAQVQPQTLEMVTNTTMANSGPTGSGPTGAPQTVTFRRNTNNPAGTTFQARTPTVTVTYSWTNQQYSTNLPAGYPGAAMFGGNNGLGFPGAVVYGAMNAISPSFSNAMMTGSGNSATGTGMNATLNAGIWVYTSSSVLARNSVSTSQRAWLADLVLTFSQPVDNPILHLGELGTTGGGTTQISTEFDVLGGPTVTLLSGNGRLAASGTAITNTSPGSFNCSSDAACGSVRVNGIGLSSITLRTYMKGNPANGTFPGSGASAYGDAFMFGVSLDPVSDYQILKTNTIAVSPSDQASDMVDFGSTQTYVLTVTNNGVEATNGAVITDTIGTHLNCPGGNTVTRGGNLTIPITGPLTVAQLTGAGLVAGAWPAGETITFSFQCTVN